MSNCKFSSKRVLVFICLLSAIAISCEKESTPLTLPTIKSSKIFTLSSNAITIKSTFDITNKEGITTIGICWDSQSNPSVCGNFTSSSLSDSILYTRIEGLVPNTKYYARVYASNKDQEVYGPEIEFTTNNTVEDIEGNFYNTVTIGTQTWMVENLKTTKYNDGSDIPFVSSSTNWAEFNSSGYNYYDYQIVNKNLYGALYNWQVVNSGELCPDGWHIPTDKEWTTLIDYLGGEDVASEFLKAVGNIWPSTNNEANNYSGFCALPGGESGTALGSFSGLGREGIWWSSTIDHSSGDSEGWNITRAILENSTVQRNGFSSNAGTLNFLSVRCIKN
ncbi:fibrobacter succinogenes major paralogous domain-containing protein [Marinifilum fragile]|uniref:fibrobacter succinogenes major paralogous domain-containing protein n=1 Tax=Marinifilum fragile TaxID=570161 RepID=UPI002AA94669|nr:fibrobacter succinogenes major paralogous domain-containing protein [Marinifilum fragile]